MRHKGTGETSASNLRPEIVLTRRRIDHGGNITQDGRTWLDPFADHFKDITSQVLSLVTQVMRGTPRLTTTHGE
jgi:hypothetical protein